MSLKTVKDLTAGTAGGVAQVRFSEAYRNHEAILKANQVLVGQPFDIVKVVRGLSLRVYSTRLSGFFYAFSACKRHHRAHTRAW